jgi:hypothetical protein
MLPLPGLTKVGDVTIGKLFGSTDSTVKELVTEVEFVVDPVALVTAV